MNSNFLKHIAGGIALALCISCVDVDPQLGGDLIPTESRYKMFSAEIPIDEVQMKMADSLSGFSSTRITIGAVRDEDFGLSTRGCAMTLVPLMDTVNFGKVQSIKHFRLTAAPDSISVSQKGQEHILQNVYVRELNSGLDYSALIDASDEKGQIQYGSASIVKGTPIINGTDSLTLDFTDDYAWKYVNYLNGKILSDSLTFDAFLKDMPGIWIETDTPAGNGGRINNFKLQMGYNSSYYYLEDNYGEISVNSIFNEQTGAVDTTFYFYYGALKYYGTSTLLSDYSSGTFPQYAFNVSKHSSRDKAGSAEDMLYVEGGSGLKPVISATSLISIAKKCIADSLEAHGLDAALAEKAVINKATIVLPFEMPEDYTRIDEYYPPRLSPTCRIVTDSTSTFMGLTDASSSSENQGDINRGIQTLDGDTYGSYSPDITYHMQQLIRLGEDNENIAKGNYDIWMLIMKSVTTTSSSSSSSSDLSEYYQYLAYQNYYNSMYGGYGYGSYGSYGSNYYSNYYSYMLAAMYASGSSSTTSTSFQLDTGDYYDAILCGPESSRVPTLRISFSVPQK